MKATSALLLFTCCLSVQFHASVLLYNAALYKPAWQSSTHFGRSADWANDGNPLTFVNGEYHGSETSLDNPSWWMVDLKGQYVIEQIVFTNREDALQATHRLYNFKIDIFKTDPRNLKNFVNISGDVCFIKTDPVKAGTFTWNCTTPITGRYLRLIKYARDYLSIVELRVMMSQEILTFTLYSRKVDSMLNLSPVESVVVSSPMECVPRCLKLRSTLRCTSFNWVTSNNTCQLLSLDTRIKDTIYSGLTLFSGIHFYMESK